MSQKTDGPSPREIATGVYYLPVRGANVYFMRSGSSWVLIDTAWRKNGIVIRTAAESLFGPNARPAAILLTPIMWARRPSWRDGGNCQCTCMATTCRSLPET